MFQQSILTQRMMDRIIYVSQTMIMALMALFGATSVYAQTATPAAVVDVNTYCYWHPWSCTLSNGVYWVPQLPADSDPNIFLSSEDQQELIRLGKVIQQTGDPTGENRLAVIRILSKSRPDIAKIDNQLLIASFSATFFREHNQIVIDTFTVRSDIESKLNNLSAAQFFALVSKIEPIAVKAMQAWENVTR